MCSNHEFLWQSHVKWADARFKIKPTQLFFQNEFKLEFWNINVLQLFQIFDRYKMDKRFKVMWFSFFISLLLNMLIIFNTSTVRHCFHFPHQCVRSVWVSSTFPLFSWKSTRSSDQDIIMISGSYKWSSRERTRGVVAASWTGWCSWYGYSCLWIGWKFNPFLHSIFLKLF